MENKLKVAVVTIFDNFNNGTYLQAFATSYVIEKLGYEVLFVNYCREFNRYSAFWNRIWRNPIKQLMAFAQFVCRRKKLQRLVTSNFTATVPYVGYKALERNPPIADIYLTGSDQVWNTEHNHGIDRAYYWGEIRGENKRIVSYAASIGLSDFNENDKDEIKRLLQRYSAISVREQSAVDILRNMGVDSTLVLDPTLLLCKQDWLGALHLSNNSPRKPYILYYSVETTEQDILLEKISKRVSSHLNLPIVQMCFGRAVKNEFVSEYVENPLPEDFVSLMAHADFVIACSFHGTAFSVNFNRPFVSVIPVAYSSRAVSLLNEFGLSGHFITEESQLDDSQIYKVNYEKINEQLREKRKHSINFLEHALQDNE